MLGLYASYYNLTAREAYDEICEKLILKEPAKAAEFIAWEDMEKAVPESIRASEDEIHHTYSILLSHLTLSKEALRRFDETRIDRGADPSRRISQHPCFRFKEADGDFA